jgi:6-phosphofructo-2-kinase / fructose-2,6-biphosphatase 4
VVINILPAISQSHWPDTFDGKFSSHVLASPTNLRIFRLGVKTRIFHLGDYRRATLPPGVDVPDDYFFVNASATSVMLRQKILKKCRDDIYAWLNHENGQVAIYDAVNPLSAGRKSLAKEFARHDVQVWSDYDIVFSKSEQLTESLDPLSRIIRDRRANSTRKCSKCQDLIARCTSAASSSQSILIHSQFVGMDPGEAAKLYLKRINLKIPDFETMDEADLNYVKMINAGQQVQVNNVAFGYISHRIVFYLMNLHIKSRQTFFARAGTSSQGDSFKADASLSPEGVDYAKAMSDTLLRHREEERAALIAKGGSNAPLKPLTIWASTRKRTVETSEYLGSLGYRVRQRSQMSQLNPGVCEKMSERRIREEYPDEVEKHELDPYHHRYPRAEVGCIIFLNRFPILTTYHSPIMILRSASSPSS